MAREATNPSSPARDPADPERSHCKSKNAKRDSIGFRFLWSWGTVATDTEKKDERRKKKG